MRRLALPILIVLGSILVLRYEGHLLLADETRLRLSRAAFLGISLLAWRFRRGRLVWLTLVLGVLAETETLGSRILGSQILGSQILGSQILGSQILGSQILGSLAPDSLARGLLAILLPLNVFWIACQREWPVLSRASLFRFAVLAGQIACLVGIQRAPTGTPWVTSLEAWIREPLVSWSPNIPMAQPALAIFLLVAIGLFWKTLSPQGTHLDAGWLGVHCTLFLAFTHQNPRYFLTAGALVLGWVLIEQAFSLAFEDGLTGLPGRRALEEALPHLGRKYTIAMVDIDHFKKINDRYGHDVGDQVLRAVGSRLANVGGRGRPFRYGGEEFCLIFNGRTVQSTKEHLEELRQSIARHAFAIRSAERPKRKPRKKPAGSSRGQSLKITVSIGAAERNSLRSTPDSVLKTADKALYKAKKTGRNRVVVSR